MTTKVDTKNMLVKFVRDENNQPIGCVVAMRDPASQALGTSYNHINLGWSKVKQVPISECNCAFCREEANRLSDRFDKDKALMIAVGRANSSRYWVDTFGREDNPRILHNGQEITFVEPTGVILPALKQMAYRAVRYFK